MDTFVFSIVFVVWINLYKIKKENNLSLGDMWVWLIFSVGVIFVVIFVGVRFAGVVFVRISMLVNVVKGSYG